MKKYELPQQKVDREGGDLVSQSLKYMGMGGLVKAGEKGAERVGETVGEKATEGQPTRGEGEDQTVTRVTSKAGMPSWMGFGRGVPGEPSQRQRKKSVAEEQEEEDDRNIRFTIGGVGQRMTKEDFIQEMKKLDKSTRREVVDHSSASHVVKTLAKQDPSRPEPVATQQGGRGKTPASKTATAEEPNEEMRGAESSRSSSVTSSGPRGESPGRGRASHAGPSRDTPETAVERRRRLAVLGDIEDEGHETPAERRRREAALGMASQAVEDDSEDDDTPRVPPARRGIRFADTPGKKGN